MPAYCLPFVLNSAAALLAACISDFVRGVFHSYPRRLLPPGSLRHMIFRFSASLLRIDATDVVCAWNPSMKSLSITSVAVTAAGGPGPGALPRPDEGAPGPSHLGTGETPDLN